MNLTQLKYFRTVYMCSSVSKAAEMLYISQPSLSCAIKELEKEFGVNLFSRHHKGMVPTSEGDELFKLSDGLLSHAEKIERIMCDLGAKKKTLRLGIPPMIGSFLLPEIYGEFTTLHSNINIDITEAGKNELSSLLEKNLLDMVVLPHNESLGIHLNSKKITQLEIVCCAKKNHAITKNKVVKPHDLKDIPLVLFKNSFFQTEEIKKWFKESEITPKILMQTDQFSTLKNIISSGIASGFLFRRLIDANSDLDAISMHKPIFADVSLVWKKNSLMYSAMDDFLEFMINKFCV